MNFDDLEREVKNNSFKLLVLDWISALYMQGDPEKGIGESIKYAMEEIETSKYRKLIEMYNNRFNKS